MADTPPPVQDAPRVAPYQALFVDGPLDGAAFTLDRQYNFIGFPREGYQIVYDLVGIETARRVFRFLEYRRNNP